MNAEARKNLGAYYTDEIVAKYLVKWAIRSQFDNVLDPSYGEGVFLSAAREHFHLIWGQSASNIYGIDIQSSPNGLHIPTKNLIQSDFFKVDTACLPPMDSVIGNPPFIRYQKFSGDIRERALKIANQAGVKLSALSSSWAPFVIHSTQFLRVGGRLAMVIPAEINHASYALPVMRYILDNFREIKIIAFQNRIFADLSQDTFLILADRYGEKARTLSIIVANDALELSAIDLENGTPVDIDSIRNGKNRIIEYLLPYEIRSIYYSLLQTKFVKKLGEISDVGIGYVTGANEYFHLSKDEVSSFNIPHTFLKRALRSGRQIKGVIFSEEDWKEAEYRGEKIWLLAIPKESHDLPISVMGYLRKGKKDGIDNSFKSKAREKWYSVPHVYVGDAFLSYMSGNAPKLVSNKAKVVATNTIHVVKLLDKNFISPENLAFNWYTAFTLMSCEIEGHAMGGGMLKLEPSEAERVNILTPKTKFGSSDILHLNRALRFENLDIALNFTDQKILINELGLTKNDCILLREGYNYLRKWRMR